MKIVRSALSALIREEAAQDLVEYALVAALIGLGAVTAMNGLANAVTNTFAAIANTLTNAV